MFHPCSAIGKHKIVKKIYKSCDKNIIKDKIKPTTNLEAKIQSGIKRKKKDHLYATTDLIFYNSHDHMHLSEIFCEFHNRLYFQAHLN